MKEINMKDPHALLDKLLEDPHDYEGHWYKRLWELKELLSDLSDYRLLLVQQQNQKEVK